MKKILMRKKLADWIKSMGDYTVITPDKDENRDEEWPISVVPIKRYVFPQKEELFEFQEIIGPDAGSDAGNGPAVDRIAFSRQGPAVGRSEEPAVGRSERVRNIQLGEIMPTGKQAVIFGIRPCEGRALQHYDVIFGGDFEDPYYRIRRDNTTMIGLACNTPPSDSCFCTSVNGSPHSADGLDVLLIDLGDRYLVESFTPKGEKLLKAGADHLTAAGRKDEKHRADIWDKAKKQVAKTAKHIPLKLGESFELPVWDELAERCIECGICTYLCPTCHCFDMNDEVCCNSPLKGKRVRSWDTCQFPDFTMHSSGHNPRSGKAARLRQRILHKFLYSVECHGEYLCTGCGRCIRRCPVGIDIIEVLEKVVNFSAKGRKS